MSQQTTPDLSAVKAASRKLHDVLFDASTKALGREVFEAWREWEFASRSAGLLIDGRPADPVEVAMAKLTKIAAGRTLGSMRLRGDDMAKLAQEALEALKEAGRPSAAAERKVGA
jgi:hypothetical protein